MLPLETLPPGEPNGGVFYLRIVLSPEQASRMWVFLNISVWLVALHLSIKSGNTFHHPCNRKYGYFLLLILHRSCSRHDTPFPLILFQPMHIHPLCTVHQQACVHFQSFGFLLLVCCGGWCPLNVYNFTCISQFTMARDLVLCPLAITPSVCCVTDPHMLQLLSWTAACMQLTHLLSSKPFVPLCSSLSIKPCLSTYYLDMDPYLVGILT